MKEELYLDDCYIKEFDAKVVSVKDDRFVVLDQTIFYPNGGGQLNDTGKLILNSASGTQTYNVIFVGKFDGKISHEVDKVGLKEGDLVKCVLDWDRRYKFMRSHTAAHILSGVIHKETGAKITGNQISEEKIRVDFSLENFDREEIKDYEAKANSIITKSPQIKTSFLSREDAFKIPSLVKLKMQLPESITQIRIVEIEDFDIQACAGTHVKNAGEIKGIEILKAENKGKQNRRIYFKLVG